MSDTNILLETIWNKVNKKLKAVSVRSRNKLPYTSIDGVHDDFTEKNVNWWTNGFFGGMMWLMYAATKDEDFRLTAERSEELLDSALAEYDKLDHDVGFLWHILSGASYKLTGNKKSRTRNLYVASVLFSRYNISGGYIKAWNGDDRDGRSIIDCMMNLPLLYWATEEIGDSRFKKIAMSHADMALRDHIRDDGTVNHIVEHDVDTGDVLKVDAGQGYSETSCWSRGLAWAVYGMAISYKYTGKKEYLEAAIKCANYFIVMAAATDYKTPVDFKSPAEPEYYDSTAGVCTACGLIELAGYVSEAEGKAYLQAAIKIIKATDENFADYDEQTDSLVTMGTGRYPKREQDFRGVHIPIIYGDFFYVEALTKLMDKGFDIW